MRDPTNATNKNAMRYGRSMVAVSLIVEPSERGTISRSLRWRFYIPEENLKEIDEALRPRFQTKPAMGEEVVKQAVAMIGKATNKHIQITFDSGYVSEDLFKATDELRVNVVTRFKSNANFYKLPRRPAKSRHGRPRVYGDKFGGKTESKLLKRKRSENIQRNTANPDVWSLRAYPKINQG